MIHITVYSTAMGHMFHVLITAFIYSLTMTVCAISETCYMIRRIIQRFLFPKSYEQLHNPLSIPYPVKQKLEHAHTHTFIYTENTCILKVSYWYHKLFI